MLAEYRQTTGETPVSQPMLAAYGQATGYNPVPLKTEVG
jgi:hypothetical protein